MSIFASHDEKSRRALAESIDRRSHANAELEGHRLAPADPGDNDAIRAWQDREAILQRDVEIADSVVAHWQGVVAKLEKEAAEKAAVAERAAAENEAVKLESLVHEIARENAKQKARIAKLGEHIERAKAAGVEDAEVRARRGPARTVPAITQTVTAWFGPDGARYGSDTTHDAEGRSVKASDRVQREVVDVIREEVRLPGDMPERYADAIRLVDLQGHVL